MRIYIYEFDFVKMFIAERHEIVVSVCADFVFTNIVDVLTPYGMSLRVGCNIKGFPLTINPYEVALMSFRGYED